MAHPDRVPDGKPILTKVPKLLLNDDKAGKPEGIHLVIGRRPVGAAVYHLGHFGTAAEKLHEFDLKP